MTRYIGIDPGLDGAIAYLWADQITIYDTPVAQVGSKRTFLVSRMAEIIKEFTRGITPLVAAIEAVHSMPGQGVVSAFSFGKGVGLWIGIFAALEIPYVEVPPQRWKGIMMDGMQKEKDASRVRAMQMYPQFTEQLKLKKHHGRADALLIASWRKQQG